MISNRKTTDGFVEIGSYTERDYDRLRLKALDKHEDNCKSIWEWVAFYVSALFNWHESLHQYKNRLKKLLSQ